MQTSVCLLYAVIRTVVQIGSLGRKESSVIASSNCFFENKSFYMLIFSYCWILPKFFTLCDLGYAIALVVLQVLQLLELHCLCYKFLIWATQLHWLCYKFFSCYSWSVTTSCDPSHLFAMLMICIGFSWHHVQSQRQSHRQSHRQVYLQCLCSAWVWPDNAHFW